MNNKRVCVDEEMNGKFKCKKYAHENCCLFHQVCIMASRNGHSNCLKCHENGCPWDELA